MNKKYSSVLFFEGKPLVLWNGKMINHISFMENDLFVFQLINQLSVSLILNI